MHKNTVHFTKKYSPFVGEEVEFSVKLTHGDGLGVKDVCVDAIKYEPGR